MLVSTISSWERQMSPEVLLLMNELTGEILDFEPVVESEPAGEDALSVALRILAIPAIQRVEILHSDQELLVFLVRGAGWKLREVAFTKRSLERLAIDPASDAKVEYLKRDIERSAEARTTYRYPRRS